MTDTTDATNTTEPPEPPEPLEPPEALNEPLGAATESHRPSARLSFGVAFMLGLVAALLLGVGALYAYDRQFSGRILPGVHVGMVDLSGLTADDARAELTQAYGALADGRLVLTGAAGEHVITYVEVGRGPDLDAMITEAIAVGRNGTPVDRAVADARTAVRGVFLEPRVTFDGAKLTERVTAVSDSLRTDPTDARVDVNSDGLFQVIEGNAGKTADPTAVIAAFATALVELDAPDQVSAELRLTTLDPMITTDEATAAKAQAERLTAPISLVVGDERLAIVSAKLRPWVAFATTADGAYGPTLDSAPLAKLVEALAPKVDREPVNATFTVSGGKITGVTPSKDGHKLDVPATVAQIQALLSARNAGFSTTQVVPILAVTSPALTTAQAEAAGPQMQKISEWTTYFPISERNGFGANIWIPALTIDGYIVGPRETFDFWNAIGPITREKGYVDGGAIINGKSEPQGALAGGICSCSTTLFNAALRAGFEMGARRNHFYYIDRYPLGLDATVFISASGAIQTMSWTNDTDYPVLIRGYKIRNGTRGYVKFELYSVPTGRTVVIGDPIVKNVKPASDTTLLTTSLSPGVHKRVEFPVDGKQVWRTRTVYDAAGNVIHTETYYSNYSRITGVTLVGAPSTAAAEIPEPTPAP
jgi:vancomycin resistance protein YoaR